MHGQAADAQPIGPARSTMWAMPVGGFAGNGTFAVLAIFLPPALLLFTLFVVLPIGEAAWYSGFNWNGFGRPTNWIGLDNYRFVLQTRAFWLALRNNGLIIAVSLLIQLPLALGARARARRSLSRRGRATHAVLPALHPGRDRDGPDLQLRL